ncbi:hypothetical protein DIPPA_19729 [Diplonema papillatum]|nr:hypothetical protein DIPPA_19729 [Diplonema papillatum]
MERGTAGSPRRCQSLKAAVGLLWDEVEGLGVCRRVAVGGCEGDAAGWSADDLSSLLDALICALHDLLVLSEKRWLRRPGAGEKLAQRVPNSCRKGVRRFCWGALRKRGYDGGILPALLAFPKDSHCETLLACVLEVVQGVHSSPPRPAQPRSVKVLTDELCGAARSAARAAETLRSLEASLVAKSARLADALGTRLPLAAVVLASRADQQPASAGERRVRLAELAARAFAELSAAGQLVPHSTQRAAAVLDAGGVSVPAAVQTLGPILSALEQPHLVLDVKQGWRAFRKSPGTANLFSALKPNLAELRRSLEATLLQRSWSYIILSLLPQVPANQQPDDDVHTDTADSNADDIIQLLQQRLADVPSAYTFR